MKINYKKELCSWYKSATGEFLDLDNPQTFNEKMQWLKLYDSTPIKSRLADKLLVRDYIKEQLGAEYSIPLLGVYNSYDEIDFSKLPQQFVIKCNHGSGYNIIVKNKDELDYTDAKKFINLWMHENFAHRYWELHYSAITPKIIIEEYKQNEGWEHLIGYKIWCFGGKPTYIQFYRRRGKDLRMVFLDTNWRVQPFNYETPYTEPVAKPDNLAKMLEIATKLSQGFPLICVDLYRADDGTLYFGELTFTRTAGVAKWNDKKYDKMLGDLITLPERAYDFATKQYIPVPHTSKLQKLLTKISNFCYFVEKEPYRKVIKLFGLAIYKRKYKENHIKTYLFGLLIKTEKEPE